MSLQIRFVLSILLPLALFRAACAANETVDFVRDIQPLLKEHCYSCHGPDKQKGQLRLDSKTLAMQGGATGASIIPGDSKKSYFMQRVRGEGDESRMPEKAPPLSAEQTALLAKWIDAGAVWPDSASTANASLKKHWAYEKPSRPALPAVKNAAWVRNPIDTFILARLEKEGLQPSPEAPREVLLRRVSLDLIGLPPTPVELDAFLKDTSSDAYEKAVDRLLASPHYGERWARLWLDLARYADTDGFNFDTTRVMWPYRDAVVKALNDDQTFDQFTLEQLAGDMLPNATPEQRVAAGFHRNTMKNTEGGVDPEEARWETLLDRTHTTATVWLGSTLACAQCHNHKYDPFSQKDYYAFLAFFDNSDETTIDPKTGLPARPGKKAKTEVDDTSIASDERKKKTATKEMASPPTTLSFTERLALAETDLRLRGAFTSKGERVGADTPRFLPPLSNDMPKNRYALAKWLVDEQNPLTARVTADRYWDALFGRGLVDTPEDFGTQGERPTHPELLDWMAVELREKGWKLKAFQKLLVTSATYRQSSKLTPALREKDPLNKLYARAARHRMDAETLRDNALAISGLLSTKMGGPGVYPPMPATEARSNNKVSNAWPVSTGEDRYRRGLYTFVRRTAPYAMFTTFDGPSREFCAVKRPRTNTPLQALVGLNDPASIEFAQGFAQRLMKEGGPDAVSKIRYAVKLCTAREATPKQLEILEAAYKKEFEHFTTDLPAAAKTLKGPIAVPKNQNAAEAAAWTVLANVLLNMDETITRE
jgi:mono/diheme cytochrome c family protein